MDVELQFMVYVPGCIAISSKWHTQGIEAPSERERIRTYGFGGAFCTHRHTHTHVAQCTPGAAATCPCGTNERPLALVTFTAADRNKCFNRARGGVGKQRAHAFAKWTKMCSRLLENNCISVVFLEARTSSFHHCFYFQFLLCSFVRS